MDLEPLQPQALAGSFLREGNSSRLRNHEPSLGWHPGPATSRPRWRSFSLTIPQGRLNREHTGRLGGQVLQRAWPGLRVLAPEGRPFVDEGLLG